MTTKSVLDIPYLPGSNNPAQTLDLHIPLQARNGPVPLVVWIHGGAWRAGSKTGGPYKLLLANGFAVASINYRLSEEAKFPAQIYDCKAAIRWLRAHGSQYNLDTKRIGAWGASAGGHLAALLGATNGTKHFQGNTGNLEYSSDVEAVCDYCGLNDLRIVLSETKEPDLNEPAREPVRELLGSDSLDLAKSASPINYVSGNAPPFLIVHGDQDSLVPVQQSQLLFNALKQAGAKATLRIVPGGGHGMAGYGDAEEGSVVEFFKQTLLHRQIK